MSEKWKPKKTWTIDREIYMSTEHTIPDILKDVLEKGDESEFVQSEKMVTLIVLLECKRGGKKYEKYILNMSYPNHYYEEDNYA